MNSQPWALSPSAEMGPKLYHGSQNDTRRTKVATPTIQSLPFRAFSRCRDLPTRLGIGRGITGGLMAAPHLGQSAVPGDTSTRHREQAGKSTILLPAVAVASAQVTSRTGYPPKVVRLAPDERRVDRLPYVPEQGPDDSKISLAQMPDVGCCQLRCFGRAPRTFRIEERLRLVPQNAVGHFPYVLKSVGPCEQ